MNKFLFSLTALCLVFSGVARAEKQTILGSLVVLKCISKQDGIRTIRVNGASKAGAPMILKTALPDRERELFVVQTAVVDTEADTYTFYSMSPQANQIKIEMGTGADFELRPADISINGVDQTFLNFECETGFSG